MSHRQGFTAPFFAIELSFLELLLQEMMNPTAELLLPDPLPAPYRGSDYTLVLDLEETLLHSEWTVCFYCQVRWCMIWGWSHTVASVPVFFLASTWVANGEAAIFGRVSAERVPRRL